MRATAPQVSSGFVPLRRKNLAMKDHTLPLTHTRVTYTAPKKFPSRCTAQNTNTANTCLWDFMCMNVHHSCVHYRSKKSCTTATAQLLVICFHFNYYGLLDLISFRECFYKLSYCTFFPFRWHQSVIIHTLNHYQAWVLTFFWALYSLE